MFFVVIQLGAIIAVIYMYWDKLWPFRIVKPGDEKRKKTKKDAKWKNEYRFGSIGVSRPIINLWSKVLVATIPAAVIGLLLDDWMDEHMHKPELLQLCLSYMVFCLS